MSDLPDVEYNGKKISAKSGFYKCPNKCGDSRYPQPKYKSEKGNSMQDLEELKEMLNKMKMHDGFQGLTISQGLELIDRLQAAEKNLEFIEAERDGFRANRDNLIAELKALREQKPVAWRKEHKVDIGVAYSYTSTLSHVEDWEKLGVYLTPLYANPVAQSRDSAEPVGYMDDIGDIIKASIFNQLGYDPKTTKYSIPVYEHAPRDHFRGALKMVEAKQAVPEGYRLLPIEPTQMMLDAGFYADSRRRGAKSIWLEMLAAAPQPEGAAPEPSEDKLRTEFEEKLRKVSLAENYKYMDILFNRHADGDREYSQIWVESYWRGFRLASQQSPAPKAQDQK